MSAQTITINLGRDGVHTCSLDVPVMHRAGAFAVHQRTGATLDNKAVLYPGCWTVTHVPTGWSVSQVIESEAAAIWLADQMAAHPKPWDKLTVDEIRAFSDQERQECAALIKRAMNETVP